MRSVYRALRGIIPGGSNEPLGDDSAVPNDDAPAPEGDEPRVRIGVATVLDPHTGVMHQSLMAGVGSRAQLEDAMRLWGAGISPNQSEIVLMFAGDDLVDWAVDESIAHRARNASSGGWVVLVDENGADNAISLEIAAHFPDWTRRDDIVYDTASEAISTLGGRPRPAPEASA